MTMTPQPLVAAPVPLLDELVPDASELAQVDAWWQACNYLTIGQIYLKQNPLLRQPLTPDDIKPRLLGHWGTSPGLSFVYAHMSRLIRATGQEMIYLAGPRARRSGTRSRLARGQLQRDVPAHHSGHGRDGQAVPAVLHARRHPEPRLRDDAGLHSRRR